MWQARERQKLSSKRNERSILVAKIKDEAFKELFEDLGDALGEKKQEFTLRNILSDYEENQRKHELRDTEIRRTCNDAVELKNLHFKLQQHFATSIAFQKRYRRNQSSIVLFPEHGGAYAESAVNSWGIDTLLLLKIVVKLLHSKHKDDSEIQWLCSADELVIDKTPDNIHNLVSLIADPNAKLKLVERLSLTDWISR